MSSSRKAIAVQPNLEKESGNDYVEYERETLMFTSFLGGKLKNQASDMIDDEELTRILREAKTIAVVGCSRDPQKDAHRVPKYLKENGYKIIPVNPFADEILGEKAYKKLTEIKEPVDIVDVFRPSVECLQVVREALNVKPKVIWMQLGIRSEEAAKLAESNGIKVIMNTCMMAEHRRLIKK